MEGFVCLLLEQETERKNLELSIKIYGYIATGARRPDQLTRVHSHCTLHLVLRALRLKCCNKSLRGRVVIDKMEKFPMTVIANRIALGIERAQADPYKKLQIKRMGKERKEKEKNRGNIHLGCARENQEVGIHVH